MGRTFAELGDISFSFGRTSEYGTKDVSFSMSSFSQSLKEVDGQL